MFLDIWDMLVLKLVVYHQIIYYTIMVNEGTQII